MRMLNLAADTLLLVFLLPLILLFDYTSLGLRQTRIEFDLQHTHTLTRVVRESRDASSELSIGNVVRQQRREEETHLADNFHASEYSTLQNMSEMNLHSNLKVEREAHTWIDFFELPLKTAWV